MLFLLGMSRPLVEVDGSPSKSVANGSSVCELGSVGAGNRSLLPVGNLRSFGIRTGVRLMCLSGRTAAFRNGDSLKLETLEPDDNQGALGVLANSA